MYNSNLIKALKSFNRKERTQFLELVDSPFFNKNRKVRQLGAFVLKFAPDFSSKELEKRNVYHVIYGIETPFNEYQINNVISDLLQLLYQFLIQRGLEKREAKQFHFLMEELLEKELNKQGRRIGQKYTQLLKKSPNRNHEFYLDEYYLQDQLDREYLTQSDRAADAYLQFQNDALDKYYFANKLRLACGMANRNLVIKAGYESTFLEQIIQIYRDDETLQKMPALSIYYKALQTIRSKEKDQYYQELKQSLANHLTVFPQEELFTLYNYALNFCIKKINSGEHAYYREIWDLYKVLIAQKINYKNGYLTQWTFKNMVTVSIRLKEFEWAETFIETYQEDLLPEEKTQAVAYNLAMLFYAKGNYEGAVFQLHNIEFSDAFYHLGAKAIQLQSYFELEETEAFLSLIKASLQYIRRNRKLSDYHKLSNANYFKFTKQVYLLKMQKTTISKKSLDKKRKALIAKLEILQPVVNKEWLESQIVLKINS